MFSSVEANYEENKYKIYISDNLTKNINIYLNSYDKNNILLIVDSVFKNKELHPDKNFTNLLNQNNVYYIKGGILSKELTILKNIFKVLNKKNIFRDGVIVAIGGGVVGDITGLAASLYCRGINLIHIPTTMTAMVDSAIGGKTGVNFNGTVNMLGSYYHPKATFIDLRFLRTLQKRDFMAGISESIKKAIIMDEKFFNFLLNNSQSIKNLVLDKIYDLVSSSISIKLHLTLQDVNELSSRLLLNYGHTFGQTIESYYGINQKNLRHGEAVALGMMCASKLAEHMYGNKSLFFEQKEILNKYSLPTKLSNLKRINHFPKSGNLIKLLSFYKKKNFKGNRFIVCEKIGKANIEYYKNTKVLKSCLKLII